MQSKTCTYFFFSIILILCLLTPACAPASSNQPTRPVINLTFPPNGTRLAVGQTMTAKFSATDAQGLVQVELTINSQPVYVKTINPPVNAFVADYAWTPDKGGSYIIPAMAFSLNGNSSDPAQVVVTVGDTAAQAVPTPAPVNSTPAPVQSIPAAGATNTPPLLPTFTPTPLSAATGDQVNLKPLVMARVDLNVRAGPSKEYPVLGRLSQGQTAEIIGRDPLTAWWQIIFPSTEGNTGWVATGSDFSTASNTTAVPVVAPPPPPIAVSVTATFTPTPPPAPSPLKPVIYSFTADRYAIAAGESVKLSWDLANAKAAFLRYEGQEEGVVAPGHKIVAPLKDTVYTLAARNDAGETTAQLTIKVGGNAPTPVPVLGQGKLGVKAGQYIDFDQGVALNEASAGADFFWDGQKKQFVPKGGADGAMLNMSYTDITLPRCLAAPYGRPLNADPNLLMTGCYKTTDKRYGKFNISAWDVTGNLTIEWLTWDYR